jgi:hypothetical protein
MSFAHASVASLAALLLAVPAAAASPGDPFEERARALVQRYEATDHWAVQAIVLLSLGEVWHPVAGPLFADAMKRGDERLKAFAAEVLAVSHPVSLQCGLSRAALDQIVNRELRDAEDLYRERLLALLDRRFPYQGLADGRAWRRWWAEERGDYEPMEWPGSPAPEDADERTRSMAFVERALDLSRDGLELVFCLDTTGSMQSTIDAARAAIGDIVVLLGGITPEMKVGLVHYRDMGDDPDGAELLVPLTEEVAEVESALAELRADGGGDFPERVELGLKTALAPELGWRRSTNKLVIVVGDAPPHDTALPKAVEMAREAHERPFGREPTPLGPDGKPKRSARYLIRPFVVSAIGVGLGIVQEETEEAFRVIAAAGGGTYGELIRGPSPEEDQPRVQVIEQVLRLSFGTEHAEALRAFIEIYLRYHDAGIF